MSKRSHSIGLKLFIFFLVAMMLFSAIGVMVIYLNAPTQTMTTPVSLPSDIPTTITLPSTENNAQGELGANNEADGTQQPVLDQEEVPTETAPAQGNDAAEPTPNNEPTEVVPEEPTLPAQE